MFLGAMSLTSHNFAEFHHVGFVIEFYIFQAFTEFQQERSAGLQKIKEMWPIEHSFLQKQQNLFLIPFG